MNKIEYIASIIDSHFKQDELTYLKEEQADMRIEFENDGQRFLSFSFDKNLSKNIYPKGLFPFFNRGVPKVTSFCDYVLFTETSGTLYILLIELKKGDDKVTEQLYAGKCFVEFIISTVNRVYEQNIKPEIRLISIRERHIKPKQKQKEIEYDENNFHTFSNQKFRLKAYLK